MTRPWPFYDSILPYHQNDNIDVRGAEPYAYVQFIYGRDHEWFGKAQNPWLTGTAGWMYTAVTKWILGVRLDPRRSGRRPRASRATGTASRSVASGAGRST